MNDLFTIHDHTCLGYNPEGKPCYHFLEGGFCDLPTLFRCTEFVKVHEPILSYSSIRTYSHCRRAFWYEWIMGLKSITPTLPLLKGSISSRVMVYLHTQDEIGRKTYIDIIFDAARPYMNEGDKTTLWPYAMVGFFDGYVELKYHEAKCRCEVEFLWDEPEYPKVKGYIDRIPNLTGEDKIHTIAYEDKYSSSPDWYELYTLKDQLTTYFLGIPDFQRITARILVHPDLRLAKNETIKDYVERVKNDVVRRSKHYIRDFSFWRTEFDYDAYKWKIKVIAKEIVEGMKYGIGYFYQDTEACFSPPCQFRAICSSNDVISDTAYKKREFRDHHKKDEKIEKETQNETVHESDDIWTTSS